MSRKKLSVIFAAVFLVFIAIMDYPFVARLINKIDEAEVVADYDALVLEKQKEDLDEERAEAVTYNQELYQDDGLRTSVPFMDEELSDNRYQSLLNIHHDGVMGIIEIPKINVSLPIYHGTSNAVLEKGAGHLEGSSLPVGGENTHAVIAAHRGLPTKRLFTDLDQIIQGDIFLVRVLNEVYAYSVHRVEIVTPDITRPLEIETGKDYFTLITCTPYGVNSHRIYVHGERVPYEETEVHTLPVKDSFMRFVREYWWLILTVVLFIWLLFLIGWFNRKTKSKGGESQ